MQPVTAITNGVQVSVVTHYHSNLSKPSKHEFVHSYDVTITNYTGEDIQLISRHWIITDGNGKVREIVGDGVIGLQPELSHSESHAYTSWCPLTTPIGRMMGSYVMIRKLDNSVFEVEIPPFKMIADFKLN